MDDKHYSALSAFIAGVILGFSVLCTGAEKRFGAGLELEIVYQLIGRHTQLAIAAQNNRDRSGLREVTKYDSENYEEWDAQEHSWYSPNITPES